MRESYFKHARRAWRFWLSRRSHKGRISWEKYRRLLAAQPWLKRELTTTEFARAIGADPETVRAMLRDGLLPDAYKVRGPGRGRRAWRIPIGEVDRFQKKKGGDL